VGWNIVTSFSDNTYRNYGHDKLIEGSWDEDAVRADKQAGIHADASKIHKINHVGPHFSVEGPPFVTPSPQRVPVLFQAGASPVGQRFSARNAEGVFISSPDPESARGLIDETRELAAGYGRDPYDVKFADLGRAFERSSRIVGSPTEIVDLLFPELRKRGLLSTDKSGTLRHKLSGGCADRVPATHPAAKYRDAFSDNSLADKVAEPLSLPAQV
jgi:hypothetical protein